VLLLSLLLIYGELRQLEKVLELVFIVSRMSLQTILTADPRRELLWRLVAVFIIELDSS